MNPSPNVPDKDHIVRHVPPSKLRRDDDDNVVGILGAAFKMRDKEESLSTNHLEHFKGDRPAKIEAVVQRFRSNLDVRPSAGYAIGNVGAIKEICEEQHHKVRIIFAPEDDNDAHVEVRRIPRNDEELFGILAAEHWSELVLDRNFDRK